MEITSETKVQVRFNIKESPTDGGFTDALYFTLDEFAVLTPIAIEALQLERLANFKVASGIQVNEPTPPSDEEKVKMLSAESASIDSTLSALADRKAQVLSELRKIIDPESKSLGPFVKG